MFGILKKRTKIEKLQSKYLRLLEEWHKLSTINRNASDNKFLEAQMVYNQIEDLKKQVLQ